MDREAATAGNKRARHLVRADALFHASLIAGAVVAVWLTDASDHWSIASIVLLAVFTIAGALTDLSAGPNKLRISGGTIGLIEAAVLFGPGPAAILGAATQVVAI